jgi:hypothetical protein
MPLPKTIRHIGNDRIITIILAEAIMKRLLRFFLFAAALRVSLFAAATNLPDISVLGDLTAQTSTDEAFEDRNRVTLREIELALQGYVYPEMRADVFLAMHRHDGAFEPEVCEASVSFLRLFFDGLGLQAGKVHVDFGKLNKIHQHERPFADQPLVLTNFFGPHGLVGEGAVANYLLPLPFFLRVDGAVWWIPAHGHAHDEGSEEPLEFGLAGKIYTGRLWSGFSPGDRIELEIGASGAKGNGAHYLEHQDEVIVAGGDVTLRFLPKSHCRIISQSEVLYLHRTVPVGTLERMGAYSYLGMQLNKYWDAGARYDWSENAFPDALTSSLVSAICTYRFTETTRFRVQYGFDPEASSHSAAMQLVFGIGPHTHPLQ